MEDILASNACIGERALDAVVKNSQTGIGHLLGRDVEIWVGVTDQLPALHLTILATTTTVVERLGLDAQRILIARKHDTVILVGRGGGSRGGIDKAVGDIVHNIEILGLQSPERTGITHREFDGIDHHIVDITHTGVGYYVFNLCRRARAGCKAQQQGASHKIESSHKLNV